MLIFLQARNWTIRLYDDKTFWNALLFAFFHQKGFTAYRVLLFLICQKIFRWINWSGRNQNGNVQLSWLPIFTSHVKRLIPLTPIAAHKNLPKSKSTTQNHEHKSTLARIAIFIPAHLGLRQTFVTISELFINKFLILLLCHLYVFRL